MPESKLRTESEIKGAICRVQAAVDPAWQTLVKKHHRPSDARCERHRDAGPNIEQCRNPATETIIINVWGTGCEYYACDEHKDFHGKWTDGFV